MRNGTGMNSRPVQDELFINPASHSSKSGSIDHLCAHACDFGIVWLFLIDWLGSEAKSGFMGQSQPVRDYGNKFRLIPSWIVEATNRDDALVPLAMGGFSHAWHGLRSRC